MPYATRDPGQVMGIGGYVGEVLEGPDGQLYEVVEGVDGLGNPIGLSLRRIVGRGLKFAAGALMPSALKAAARNVCRTVDQLGPVVQTVPAAIPYYGAASGFCRVLRKVGIAGVDEVPPAAAALVPTQARSMAGRVCGVIDKLGRIVRFIPPLGGPYRGLTKLCGALRQAGVAGVGDEIMEGPDGRLYEVVEGIGEAGRAPRRRRRVWVSFPAVIGPRGARRVVRATAPASSTTGLRRSGPRVTSVGRGRPVR